MLIDKVVLKGFRNFADATVNFAKNSLIIGANNVGKTNLIYAIRLLLDKSLSDSEIEPLESDFHISTAGKISDRLSVTIYFSDVTEDAVLASLKGNVSDDAKFVLQYSASRRELTYDLKIGATKSVISEIPSRYYLKHMNLRYVKSRRDLEKYISSEKRQLLKLSLDNRSELESKSDYLQLSKIGKALEAINDRIRNLHYVKGATDAVNEELQKLAHDFSEYEVKLDSGAIQVQQFIDSLRLGASTSGASVMLGGDGRNNQILMALWKAKSQREHDPDSEVVFYCVEEPEAHLHPHQQRKLADYLINDLPGQTLITSHSPQITARYKPDSIVHLKMRNGSTKAASNGCSACISKAWDKLGYRMSILPAEAFFSKCVLLVEGPSEILFYSELAKELSIDLDFYNISILSVDGIQFSVYVKILDAMEIPWVLRTDNDVSDITVKKVLQRQLSGINRCRVSAGLLALPHLSVGTTAQSLIADGTWNTVSTEVNQHGAYLSRVDLENDLVEELGAEVIAFASKRTRNKLLDAAGAIKYLQGQKAIRMRGLIKEISHHLVLLKTGNLAKPLLHAQLKAMTL
ncbi:ATP-dependent nuclease [Pseudomonas psychrophila]|uniref:ATP-dependent nuclease n=1 Tax=Pseudomonas psychrophila TaxID=122355 RepID=UPI00381D62FF